MMSGQFRATSAGPSARRAPIRVRPGWPLPQSESGVRSSSCRRGSKDSPSQRTGPRPGTRSGWVPSADGKLVSLSHEGWEVTSRPSGYNVAGVDSTARMYACANISTAVNVVHADRATPGFMRAPPETPYMFALESAMDELAHQLNMDPVELRRVNDTQTDPVTGLPFTSRSLMACFDQAAAQFGWSKRDGTARHEAGGRVVGRLRLRYGLLSQQSGSCRGTHRAHAAGEGDGGNGGP